LLGTVSRLNRKEIAAVKRRAEAGNPEDQLKFGWICETRYKAIGLSLAEGHTQAIAWFEKAALQGNALAQSTFASLKAGNPSEMLFWYQRAAEQGEIGAAYSIGQMYLDGVAPGSPEPSQAAHWFLVAAKGGDVEAAFKVGSFYEKGYGVPQDSAEAARWYGVAAQQGWQPAELSLGELYETGRGVPKNAQEAVRWYSKIADKYGDAAYRYASLITQRRVESEGGVDAQRLYRRAAALYKRDVNAGDGAAAQKLGHMYELGIGVPRSLADAYFWYSIADQESCPAAADIQRVKGRLTAKQINDVQRRIESATSAPGG